MKNSFIITKSFSSILKLSITIILLILTINIMFAVPFDKPQVPILSLTGLDEGYNTDWYPDGRIWQPVSRGIGDTNYFLVPVFMDNKWYHYKSSSKSEVYVPDTLKSFEFRLLYDSTAVEPVEVLTGHPIRDSNLVLMPKFQDIHSNYYEPLAKDFDINWSLMPDQSYRTIFDPMVPLFQREKGWAIKISGTNNLGLPVCDTAVADMKVLLYVKFKVKLVRGHITSMQRSAGLSVIYIAHDTIMYNDWNVRVDAPFKAIRDSFPYVVEDYPDPTENTGLGGIDNKESMYWNFSPSLFGVMYLNLPESLPKLWSSSDNIIKDSDQSWSLSDTLTSSSATFTLTNSTAQTRLLDIDMRSDQEWLKFKILSGGLSKYRPHDTTLKGVINYIDNGILGQEQDLYGTMTTTDPLTTIMVTINPKILSSYNINNLYSANLKLYSKSAAEDTVNIAFNYHNINGQPQKFKVIGGGNYCEGGEGVIVALDSSQTGVIYELLLNNISIDTLKIGTGNPISFGYHTSSGTYTMIGRNIETNSIQIMDSSAVITIDSLPERPIISGRDSVCENTTELYSIDDVSETEVRWSVIGGSMMFTNDSLYQKISWGSASTGTISVLRTDINTGCYDSTVFYVTIIPRPINPIISDTSIYQGGSVVLTPDSIQNTIFYWYFQESGGLPNAISSSFEFNSLMMDTVIYVESVDTVSNCVSTTRTRVRINVTDPYVLKVNLLSYNVDVCKEDSILIGLDSAISNGTPPFTYSWYPTDGVTNPNDSVTYVKPPRTMDYTLNVTDSEMKKGRSKVNITVNSIPETPQIVRTVDTLFATPGSKFYWFLNDTLIDDELSYKLQLKKSGYYSVMAVDFKGCYSDTTEPAFFEYNPISVKDERTIKAKSDLLNLYSFMPNPVSDKGSFKVEMKVAGNLQLNIVDIHGQTVQSISSGVINAGEHEFCFYVNGISNGTYFIQAIGLGFNKQIKFQVEK